MPKPTCPKCGSTNVEVELEHEEGERIFCFDCADLLSTADESRERRSTDERASITTAESPPQPS